MDNNDPVCSAPSPQVMSSRSYSQMNNDSAADNTTINNNEVDPYLLSQLGLLPDEVDWPANSSSSSSSSSASNVPVGEETIDKMHSHPSLGRMLVLSSLIRD
jgi:hypothetical protein